MTVMLGALAAGCLAGMVSGGHLSNLARVRIRSWPILVAAVIVQATLGLVPGPARWILALACCGAVVTWCARNRGRNWLCAGLVLLGLGVVVNATVMAANRGMPVSAPALAAAGMPRNMDVTQGHLYKHVSLTNRTRLAQLGDFIPLRPVRTVLSPGDVAMLAGIAVVAWAATEPRRTVPLRRARAGMA